MLEISVPEPLESRRVSSAPEAMALSLGSIFVFFMLWVYLWTSFAERAKNKKSRCNHLLELNLLPLVLAWEWDRRSSKCVGSQWGLAMLKAVKHHIYNHQLLYFGMINIHPQSNKGLYWQFLQVVVYIWMQEISMRDRAKARLILPPHQAKPLHLSQWGASMQASPGSMTSSIQERGPRQIRNHQSD
jgi:hypothetical protein